MTTDARLSWLISNTADAAYGCGELGVFKRRASNGDLVSLFLLRLDKDMKEGSAGMARRRWRLDGSK